MTAEHEDRISSKKLMIHVVVVPDLFGETMYTVVHFSEARSIITPESQVRSLVQSAEDKPYDNHRDNDSDGKDSSPVLVPAIVGMKQTKFNMKDTRARDKTFSFDIDLFFQFFNLTLTYQPTVFLSGQSMRLMPL